MVEINIRSLNENITELNNIISEYNENCLNLFNIMKNLTTFWHDKNAKNFYDKLQIEEKNTNKIIKEIENKKNIYKYIYEEYNNLGNKIKCNLESKDIIISKIDNCISKLTEILNIFKCIDITSAYKGRAKIIKKQKKIEQLLIDYEDSKTKIKNFFNKIEQLEQSVNSKIENIENIKIDNFE